MREMLKIIDVTQFRVTVAIVAFGTLFWCVPANADLGTLFWCVPANADLDLGKLGSGATAEDDAHRLFGVSTARDTDAVAVWGGKFVWVSPDGSTDWRRIEVDSDIEEAAMSRDGVLHVAAGRRIGIEHAGELTWSEEEGDAIRDGWRALVESRRASKALQNPSKLPAFAGELGDLSIDDEGLAQKLEGDSCPCEGGGQIRELGRAGNMKRDTKWPDDDCKQGSGVGVRGWSYLLPECRGDSPPPELMARGPDGVEHPVRVAAGACNNQPTLIASNGREVVGMIGRELWRLDGARAQVIGRALKGATGLAIGKKGRPWAIRGAELWRWNGTAWDKIELVEDDC
jgi:hypothetical protein